MVKCCDCDFTLDEDDGSHCAEPAIPMILQNENGDRIHNNPLEWWAANQHKYPHIALLARWILARPATSAPSERLFSSAGLTIANDRARLTPHLANDLIFLHDVYPLLFPLDFNDE